MVRNLILAILIADIFDTGLASHGRAPTSHIILKYSIRTNHMLLPGYFKGTIDKPLTIPYKFHSAYEQCGGEPKFTIYIKSHQKSIDYIYYNDKALKVHGVLNVSPEEVRQNLKSSDLI